MDATDEMVLCSGVLALADLLQMNYEVCGTRFRKSDADAAAAEADDDDIPIAQLKRKRKRIEGDGGERAGGGWQYTPHCIGGASGDHEVRALLRNPFSPFKCQSDVVERRIFPSEKHSPPIPHAQCRGRAR